VKMIENGEEMKKIGGIGYEGWERENGGRERVCREVEEEVRERKGHCGQKRRPWAVAEATTDRGVC